jgi:hypothetical protein
MSKEEQVESGLIKDIFFREELQYNFAVNQFMNWKAVYTGLFS